MHALALGLLGVPHTPPLVGELEPGEFRGIDGPWACIPERAIGRGARLTVGWLGPYQGGIRLLLAVPLRAAGNRDGRHDQRGEARARLSARRGPARED